MYKSNPSKLSEIIAIIFSILMVICFCIFVLNWDLDKSIFSTLFGFVVTYIIIRYFTREKKKKPVFCKDCIYLKRVGIHEDSVGIHDSFACNCPRNTYQEYTWKEPITKYHYSPDIKNKDNSCPDFIKNNTKGS